MRAICLATVLFGPKVRDGRGSILMIKSLLRSPTSEPAADGHIDVIQSTQNRLPYHPTMGLNRGAGDWGYRKITSLLRADGWHINFKRVYRIWRQEGLQVPYKQHKRRRLGCSENACIRHQPEHYNHIWSIDFIMDQTSDGRRLKMLPVIDEYTRECLTLEVARRMTSESVVSTLDYLFSIRGMPKYIRSDNGPEFVAEAIRSYLSKRSVDTLYIEPGSPWQNGYVESFNSSLRDEFLNQEWFSSLKEAKVLADQWRLTYNHKRPHGALKYQTPAAFAATRIPEPPPPAPAQEYAGTTMDDSLVDCGT